MGVTMHDFITLIKTSEPCNKRMWIDGEGSIKKQPAGLINAGVARTISVPDQATMVRVLNRLSEQTDRTMVLGYIPGTENGEPYRIASQAKLANLLGVDPSDCSPGFHELDGHRYATRSKANFHPSSWFMFDYDRVPGMPVSMQYDTKESWWEVMTDLVPGLSSAGYILTPSTSSRVIRGNEAALGGGGWHAYLQAQEARDLVRFGRELLLKAMTMPHGFMRELYSRETGDVVGHRPWSIYDPTTFSSERLVFDGKPVVDGDGLQVAPLNLHVVEGERLDTSALVLEQADADEIATRTGYKAQRVEKAQLDGPADEQGQTAVCAFMLVNDRDLRLDTQIETESGSMTVGDYWRSDNDKLRAQAAFRPDSASWAAYLNRHQSGVPFLFDVGTQTKFVLPAEEIRTFIRNEVAKLDSDDPDAVERVLSLIASTGLSTVETDHLLRPDEAADRDRTRCPSSGPCHAF